jgi:Xaa-Pro dipeptidase
VNSETEIKIQRLQKMLEAQNLGGVLINSQHNFAWLTGGKSNGINSSIENGVCYLLVRNDGKSFVLGNNIEMPRILTEEISAEDFEPVEFSWQEEKSSDDFIVEKAESLLLENRKLASDLSLNDRILPIANLISGCRYSLTDEEIERYRRLGKDAGAAIGNAIEKFKGGETEHEIAKKTRNELEKFNLNSVVTLGGADQRIEQFRHPIPTENIWKKILLIAVCAKREGLIVSLSRMVCVGEISSELRRKTDAAACIFATLLSETKPEKNGSQLYNIAADAYANKGFADEINLHHQGGATGYKTRDWVIHPESNDKVFNNQAFAWNPSITGTKVEETAIISGNAIEIITATPNFPQISTEIDGKEFFAPDILKL